MPVGDRQHARHARVAERGRCAEAIAVERFGHDVSTLARAALAAKRPDIAIAGDEFHPVGRVKDFAPYIAKMRASGADAVVTGNWGNELTLLVKAAREQGLATKFYTPRPA